VTIQTTSWQAPLEHEQAPSHSRAANLLVRSAAVVALTVTAAVHVPVAVEHLQEVPYLGVAFYAFVVLAAAGAGSLLVEGRRWVWIAMGLVNLGAVLAFLISRAVGLPGATDDRGDWANTAGLTCVLAELVVVALAAYALRSPRTQP
jgi:hypothetical protein